MKDCDRLLGIVVLNWNRRRDMIECPESLFDWTSPGTSSLSSTTDRLTVLLRTSGWTAACRLGLNVPVISIHTVDYPAPARRPVYSVLANRKFELEQLNGMRPWEDALDDCLLRYQEVLSHD